MYISANEAKACPKGDVRLVEDLNTGLVYNRDFRPDLMDYDAAYQNEQAVSPHFQAHLKSVAPIIERNMGRRDIVEVGCGKGYFLEMLLGDGFDATGFDPTYEGINPGVRKEYFHAGLGIHDQGLILRHVLEHIQNPVDFLFQLKEANGGGKIYIEVPCFDWICRHRTWFDIFYEHVNYFRMSDFHRIFGTVYESSHSFGGQYLSVVADLGSLRRPERNAGDAARIPEDFVPRLHAPPSGQAAIWGGASKGVLFALMMERAGFPIDLVIDINPAKQGKYLPASGLRISSPEEAMGRLGDGATLFVMNSNYLPEVREMSGNRFKYIGMDNE